MTHPFVTALLNWYALNGRDLPWRHTQDAYSIWLSEVILQQTRVSQGMDYWHRFVGRWPTVDALAGATEDEVLREWQGLGYYSRARNLLTAARQVVAMGAFPDTVDALRRLKGVGPYTAAAVASFAFGEDVAAVDGNVLRVLSRVFDIELPIDTTQGKRLVSTLAEDLLPTGRSADYNAALMDFGAMVCTPSPQCEGCPMSELCEAQAAQTVAHRPQKSMKKKPITRALTYIYMVSDDGDIALHRRSSGDIWHGLWEPVCIAQKTSTEEVREILGLGSHGVGNLTLLACDVKHQLTHRTLLATFYLLNDVGREALPEGYQWVDSTQRDAYGVPRLVEKLYALVDEVFNPDTGLHSNRTGHVRNKKNI